jgi:hypothetical protein
VQPHCHAERIHAAQARGADLGSVLQLATYRRDRHPVSDSVNARQVGYHLHTFAGAELVDRERVCVRVRAHFQDFHHDHGHCRFILLTPKYRQICIKKATEVDPGWLNDELQV